MHFDTFAMYHVRLKGMPQFLYGTSFQLSDRLVFTLQEEEPDEELELLRRQAAAAAAALAASTALLRAAEQRRRNVAGGGAKRVLQGEDVEAYNAEKKRKVSHSSLGAGPILQQEPE